MRRIYCAIGMLAMIAALVPAQTIKQTSEKSGKAKSEANFQISAGTVSGGGTINFLPKWVGAPGTSVLGDSAVFEDKFGKVGIGTTAPTSLLTVRGMIEITLGGLKFPDGTVQSSAFTAVNHDVTLKGDGSVANPLGLAVPLIFSGSVDNGNGVITVTNVAAGGPAIFATGGNSSPTVGGGSGVIALGGSGNAAPGGVGIVGFGGNANAGSGGTGGSLIGGVARNTGNGGDGVFAVGALGTGAGKKGGRGIIAIPGGGVSGAVSGLAGEFLGDVTISGNLAKGGGSFKIDHPLDPENKYLYHSFVESPDMMNIYNGNVTTDQTGEAVVVLPEWFEALNNSFRYQLTVVGTFARAIIAEKVKNNRFTIKTDAPNVEVSWQVTGIRQDPYAEKHRIPVEEDKAARDRGAYLHPDAYDKPEDKGIAWRRTRELMQNMKHSGIDVKANQPNQ
jgi:hypothetical protein